MNKRQVQQWIHHIQTHRGCELEKVELSLDEFLEILEELNDPLSSLKAKRSNLNHKLIWTYAEQKLKNRLSTYDSNSKLTL